MNIVTNLGDCKKGTRLYMNLMQTIEVIEIKNEHCGKLKRNQKIHFEQFWTMYKFYGLYFATNIDYRWNVEVI